MIEWLGVFMGFVWGGLIVSFLHKTELDLWFKYKLTGKLPREYYESLK